MSNVCIVRASKLVNGINLKQNNKEYNPVKVFINLNDSDTSDYLDQASDCSDQEESSVQLPAKIATIRAALYQTKIEDPNALNKLCRPCVGNISI